MFSTEEEEKSRLWYTADAQNSSFKIWEHVKAKIAVKPLPLLTSILPQKLKKSIIEDDFGNVVLK